MSLKAKTKKVYLSWESPLGTEMKLKRDQLLNNYRWTILPDSPLINQAEFMQYLKKLHRLTIDFRSPELVTFPEIPGYKYGV